MLKGKALLVDGQPQAAVQALNAAEQAIERDRKMADIYNRRDNEAVKLQLDVPDNEDVKRLRLLIQGTRAQAHWDSAGKDALAAIELGRQLELKRRLEIETNEGAFMVAIRKAIGEGELEKAQALTEELITLRQRWNDRQGLTSASPERQAALAEIQSLEQRIADTQSRLEKVQRENQESGKKGSAEHYAADNAKRDNASDKAAELARLKQEQAEARRTLQQFFVKLKKDRPEVALLLGAKPTELAQLRQLLQPGQLVLQYLLMEDSGYVFLIGPDTLDTHELGIGSRGLEPLVTAFRQTLAGKAVCADQWRGMTRKDQGHCKELISDPAPLARELSKLLIEPLQAKLVGVRQLTLVPNGALHQLPFSALPIDGQPIMQRYVLNQISSASMLNVVARNPASPGATLALAVPQAPGWSPLDNVESEIKAIRQQLPDTTMLIGLQAVSTVLKGQNLAGRPLHLATHAKAGSTAETRLALTDRDFKLDEVWGLALDGSPRVVLSACETGLGEKLSGDEVVSLANGFLFAGAKSVVASLWPVPDAPTRELMGYFYEHIARGESTPKALSLAQRKMAAVGHSPYVWAAFTVTGE